jgi:hypothetical protein
VRELAELLVVLDRFANEAEVLEELRALLAAEGARPLERNAVRLLATAVHFCDANRLVPHLDPLIHRQRSAPLSGGAVVLLRLLLLPLLLELATDFDLLLLQPLRRRAALEEARELVELARVAVHRRRLLDRVGPHEEHLGVLEAPRAVQRVRLADEELVELARRHEGRRDAVHRIPLLGPHVHLHRGAQVAPLLEEALRVAVALRLLRLPRQAHVELLRFGAVRRRQRVDELFRAVRLLRVERRADRLAQVARLHVVVDRRLDLARLDEVVAPLLFERDDLLREVAPRERDRLLERAPFAVRAQRALVVVEALVQRARLAGHPDALERRGDLLDEIERRERKKKMSDKSTRSKRKK